MRCLNHITPLLSSLFIDDDDDDATTTTTATATVAAEKEKGTTYSLGHGCYRNALVMLKLLGIHMFFECLALWLFLDDMGCMMLDPNFWSDPASLSTRTRFTFRIHPSGYIIFSFGGKYKKVVCVMFELANSFFFFSFSLLKELFYLYTVCYSSLDTIDIPKSIDS